MSEAWTVNPPFVDWLHPSLLLMVGALLIPLLSGRVQQGYRVALAIAFAATIFGTVTGNHGAFEFLGFDLLTGRADPLSLVFAYVFGIVVIIGSIYALHVKDNVQHVAAYIYAASAVGVVFAGDLMTLYVFWEMMLFSSVWLIWRHRNPVAFAAGFRYLMVHAVSGVLLLGGITLYYMQTGSVAFEQIEAGGPAFWLILVGFMVNAAVPPLHAWLTDAYPEATITGAVFLSALTTKTAVYTLIRGYPGVEQLIWLGAIMALWGVVYAVLANDLRRMLAYSIVSQVGYMIAGVGMGTLIALNGAAAHAFAHILYKSLMFMAVGAVIYMVGRSKLTELGGLYRWMPITFLLYMVGAFSISAFPLFSGFVSKTMILEAAAVDGRALLWLMLSLASAGTFLYTGLRLPWFTFLGKDSGLRPQEAPTNMLVAMAIAAGFCIFIGLNPQWLYQFLPGPVDYHAYTSGHILWELQLLLFTGLGFFLFLKHFSGEAKISVDTDWIYRIAFPRAVRFVGHHGAGAWHTLLDTLRWPIDSLIGAASRHHGPQGALARTWPTGSMVLWVAVLLAASLLIYYF